MAAIDIIIRAVDKASGNLDKITKSAQSMGQQMDKVGKSMTRNLTLPIVGIGVAAIKAAKDMDSAMRNIQSVGKQTNAELQALSQTFIDMSTSGEVGTETAAGLAQAFYDIQGAGFAGADAMKVLEASSIAATAGATDTTTAMEGLTAVLNSYGLEADEAERISDIMFRTVDRGVGSYADLSNAMSNVTGTAAALNIPFEEIAAALATASKKGQDFGEASIALNQAMFSFLKPSEEMSGVLSQIGFESGAAAIKQLGFAGAMEQVGAIVGEDTELMLKLFGSVRAFKNVMAITGPGAQTFADDLAAMGESSGAARAAMEIQMQSFDNQMKLFKNNITAALIGIGNILLPVLNQIMAALTPVAQAFRGLDEGTKQWIVGIAALVAAVGPMLIITAQVISAFTMIKTTIIGIKTAIMAVNFAAMLTPWGAAITLLVGSLVLLATHWGNAKSAISGFVNYLVNLPEIMFNMGKQIISGFVNGLMDGLKEIDDAFGGIGQTAIGAIKGIFRIGSPSKLMMELGNNVGMSFVSGIHEGWNSAGGLQPLANNVASGMAKIANTMQMNMVKIHGAMAQTGGVNYVPIGQASQSSFVGNPFGGITGKPGIGGNFYNSANAAAAVGNGRVPSTEMFTAEDGSQVPGSFYGLTQPANYSGGGNSSRSIPATGLSPSYGGAGAGSGNITINIENMTLPEGTIQEQAKQIMEIITKKIQMRGLSGRSITQ